MPKVYDAVLFGATCYAAGYVQTHKNCLIIDKGINCGAEFFDAFDADEYNSSDEYTACLLSAARDRGAVNTLQLQSALGYMIKRCGCDILFETTALGAYTKPDSDVITLYSNGLGQFDIHAKRVIDTTSLGSLNYLKNDTLRSQLCKEDEPVVKYVCAVGTGGYIKLKAPFDLSFESAVDGLVNALPDGGQIAAVYDRFVYDFAEKYTLSGYNYMHIPSSQYDNPITAFECGVKGEGAVQ